MTNEVLLLILALIDLGFVFGASQFGSRWLFGTISINLILISIFGPRMISVFGLVTNAGNVFYACAFFATYLLLERKPKEDAWYTLWSGPISVTFFIILSQLDLHFVSFASSTSSSDAFKQVFDLSPRIAFASILSYVFSQYLNLRLFEAIKNKTGGKMLWFRVNLANILSQFFDSTLFFSVAFLDLSGMNLLQAIFAGWLIKSSVIIISTPLLYLDKHLHRN